MQTQSLRIQPYKSWAVSDSASKVAISRLKKLELASKLRSEGGRCPGSSRLLQSHLLPLAQALPAVRGLEKGSSRPHQIRQPQWTRQQEQQVLHLRKRYPLWGKRKLWKVLNRDQGFPLSISTVGRILRKLVKLNRIQPVSFYMGRVKPKRQRQFSHHATRWKYGMKAKQLGELLQIDHMSVGFSEGVQLKEFKATCPITGMTIMRTYRRATSRNAQSFLAYVIDQLPFKLTSIQVDGGSEFRQRPGYSPVRPATEKPQAQWLCRTGQWHQPG